MLKRTSLLALAAVLFSAVVYAQEPSLPEGRPASEDEPRPEPKRKIRVLENPYDLASFYRSSQGGAGYSVPSDERYPIAGYYRSRQGVPFGYGYAPAWHRYRARPGLVVGYRRSIGEQGDLYLFAPTFLAPVGPLTSAFFER